MYRKRPASLAARFVLPTILALLLAACGSVPSAPETSTTSPPGEKATARPEPRSPEALLRSAARASRSEAARLRLEAARAYADAGDMGGLDYALAALDVDALSGADAWRYQILRARLALARGDFAAADKALATVPDARYASAFDRQELLTMARLRAEIHEAADRPLAAARERVHLHGLLTEPELRRSNRDAIWRNLTILDATSLQAASRNARGQAELRGWLELAAIARGMYPTLEAQQQEVDLWQRRWQRHPAADPIPARLARLPQLIASRPRHVALLLPLTGDLAIAGKAVRDGFIAARFEALQDGAFAPRLTLVDSAAVGAASGYQQALDAGADLVVGPLAKTSVDAIAALPLLETPVLALNGTTDGRTAAGLIQFALLPETEGRQLADRLMEDGVERVLFIQQATSWAARIEQAFVTRFESLGGSVTATASFAGTGEVREAVADGLLVAESEQRMAAVQRILGLAPEFEPRRRQDIDAIVALADPLHGGTLKPALEYYFAGDLPIYASSHIYDAGGRSNTQALEGVRFCAMPWRILPLTERDRVEQAWPGAPASLDVFKAIGIDAWRLHARLGTDAGDARLAGVTGDLRLAAGGRIERTLTWAVMAASGAIPLPRVVTAD